jgi:isopentenyl diphosphate isomerase/L-lactate dehydrogenase-like FMN-dependent dehydrogenase
LALGADAVLLGRPLIRGAFGGGKDGVALVLNKAGRDCEVGRAPHHNAGRQNVGGAA